MGQWGLETSAGDNVYDYLQYVKDDVESFKQKDVTPLLYYVWSDQTANGFEKLGVVMHLLTHGLKVPIHILEEVMGYANTELHPTNLRIWADGRREMVVVEMNDIRYAIEHGGKGRKRRVGGLMEKMEGKEKEAVYPKTIELPCYGIKVILIDDGGGSISSDMKETCPYCDDPNCEMDCEQFQEHCSDRDMDEQQEKQAERYEFLCHRAAVDALESIILGHAIAGIDVASPAYMEGIETAQQALTNADFSVEPLG